MRILVLVALTSVATQISGATISVQLASAADAPVVRGKLTLTPVHGAPEKAIVKDVEAPGRVVLEVPEGTYVAHLDAAGFWLAPKTVTARHGAGIDLALRRTGTVQGRSESPVQAMVHFADTADPAVAGVVRCVDDETSFRCDVPAGTLDLRVAQDGHVPHYLWSVPVRPGEVETIGSFRFVPGASVSGRLAIADGVPLREPQVSLQPLNGRPVIPLRTNDKGFFFGGPIPPGDYMVTAAQKGLIAAPLPVKIRAGFEAALQEPLTLARPRRLSVVVTPPVDPVAVGWMLALRRVGPRRTRPTPVTEGAASLDGSWTADHLPPGQYELVIRPKGGPVWHLERVLVDEALTTKHIHIPSVRFEGTIRLGDEPLAAKVVLGGAHAENAIPWRSDERGRFHGYIPVPRKQAWDVTVTSDHPAVQVTLRDVPMRIDDSAALATIDIRLPSTTLEGVVVDENDAPVRKALVNVDSPSHKMTQVDTDETGHFTVHGLQPGRYQITATDFLKESEVASIDLEESSEPRLVRLKLQPYRQWEGRVTTADGRPLEGVRVIASAADVPVIAAYPARSDATGRIVLLVPAAARLFDVIVAPQGFTFNYLRVPLSEELHVKVNPYGGVLVVDFPADGTSEAAVWHNGSVMGAWSFASTWLGEVTPVSAGTSRLRVPQLDPGGYTVCLVPAGTVAAAKPGPGCVSTYLAPHGEAHVALRPSR